MSVADRIREQHGQLVRERYYPNREKTLRLNQELQKADAIKPTDGLRAFANFPEHELDRLAHKGRTDRNTPSWYADLDSRDGEIRSRAVKRLVNSSEGREYRVGSTSRKTFFLPNNPLAK